MLRVMTHNTLLGGFDGDDGHRFELQVKMNREADPDVPLIQEGRGFLANGGQRRHRFVRGHHLCSEIRSAV